jgi:hypothetical protein
MPRGALPSYTRLSHVPNQLEAYRYITRRNLTVLAAELQMSYNTVRRLCVEYSTPRDTTMEIITDRLPFITPDSWLQWKLLTESALEAEHLGDIVLLLEVEAKLRKLIPEEEATPPLHLIHECSIETAVKMHNAVKVNKTFSYYLSDLHSEAMDLLGIRFGVTKSELLRLLIDQALVANPDVMEALVRSVTGYNAQVVVPEPEPEPVDASIISVTSQEELEQLVPGIPAEEIVTQLTQDLPEEVPESTPTSEEVTTLELLAQDDLDYTSEDRPIEFEEWSPAATMDSDSNLSEEEIAKIFSGAD